jgi:hypothetical protein
MNGIQFWRERPEWLLYSVKAGAVFFGSLAIIHSGQQLLAFLVAGLVLVVLTALLLAVVVPPLFLLGWWTERAFQRIGLHLPDPMRLRAAFQAKFVSPLLFSRA